MIRAGLIGFGLAGRYFHLPLLQAAGIEVRAVVTSRQADVRDSVPAATVLPSAAALLQRSDIDLVVIATPNELHFTQARDALQAGKHVVVDKPLCIHAAEAAQLAALSHAAGRCLAVFQNRRWDSDFLTLQALIANQQLGEIHSFHARWDRYRPHVQTRWREAPGPGAGLFFDLGAHLIDQALLLFGLPQWVSADIVAQRTNARVDDTFSLVLGYPTLRVHLGGNSLTSASASRYRVHGSLASWEKDGLDPQEGQLRAGGRPLDPGFGEEPSRQWGTLTVGADGSTHQTAAATGRWLTFYELVRDGIVGATPMPVSAADAARTLTVIEAAQLSSTRGARVALTPQPDVRC